MKITFWGAARQVTGSMFLLETDGGVRILIDCGLDMANISEPTPVYPGSFFPFEPSMIDMVILTHAHLDHSGKVPNLFREGFEGKVVCTSPTRDLTNILLVDAASLNRVKINKYHKRRTKDPDYDPGYDVKSLYTEPHVKQAMEFFYALPVHKPTKITNEITVTLIPTGHLLGAVNVHLTIRENGESKSLLFSGDIGRENYPLLKDPEKAPAADYLICETTYGNRIHTSREETEQALFDAVTQACVEKPGRLLVPAFSIGRTQAVLYTFNKLFKSKQITGVKVYADSPLARKSNEIYARYTRWLNEEAQQFSASQGDLFSFDEMEYIDSLQESKALSSKNEPAVIVSSSGMLEGGRIQHHIRANIQNPDCTILMVGYSAEGTLGYRLKKEQERGVVQIGKKEFPLRAKIISTDTFSGHGDQNDLLRFVTNHPPERLKNIILVHGEPESMEVFKTGLHEKGYQDVTIPARGETVVL